MHRLDDEAQWRAWATRHPNGWIVTMLPRAARLHLAACPHARPPADGRGAPRLAFAEADGWRDWEDGAANGLWACGSCLPTSGRPRPAGLVFDAEQLCAAFDANDLVDVSAALDHEPGQSRPVYVFATDEYGVPSADNDADGVTIAVGELSGGAVGQVVLFPFTLAELRAGLAAAGEGADDLEAPADLR